VEKLDMLHTLEANENSIERTLNALKVVWMGRLLLKN
jgi:hypothetical protein